MSETPAATALLTTAVRFLKDELLPELSGSASFNLRVTINSLELVQREVAMGGAATVREGDRLADILGRRDTTEEMRSALCEQIADGRLSIDDMQLRRHLRDTVLDQIAIDQPGYSAYAAALARRNSALPQA